MLKKLNNGIVMLKLDKSFYALDNSTWSKIKKEYSVKFEVDVEGKLCNFKCF